MAWYFAVLCLLLYAMTACVLGDHFLGAIFMARPNPCGRENEVSETELAHTGGFMHAKECTPKSSGSISITRVAAHLPYSQNNG